MSRGLVGQSTVRQMVYCPRCGQRASVKGKGQAMSWWVAHRCRTDDHEPRTPEDR